MRVKLLQMELSLTLSAMVAIYLMHSMSEGNWFTSFTIYWTTFTWPWNGRYNRVSRVWKYVWHDLQRFKFLIVCTFRNAAMSGVIFRLSAASTSALACTKSWTTSKWPPFAANQRGVFPFLFRTSMWAPLQNHSLVIKSSSVPVILLWLIRCSVHLPVDKKLTELIVAFISSNG